MSWSRTLCAAIAAVALAGAARAVETPSAGTIGQAPAARPPGAVEQGPKGAPPPLGAPNGVQVHPRRMTTLPGALPGPPLPPQAHSERTPPAKLP